MEKLELQLDALTLDRTRRLAKSRGYTVEQLLTEIIEQLGMAETAPDTLLGMFAAEPELMDQVTESAMRSREEHPLRQFDG